MFKLIEIASDNDFLCSKHFYFIFCWIYLWNSFFFVNPLLLYELYFKTTNFVIWFKYEIYIWKSIIIWDIRNLVQTSDGTSNYRKFFVLWSDVWTNLTDFLTRKLIIKSGHLKTVVGVTCITTIPLWFTTFSSYLFFMLINVNL